MDAASSHLETLLDLEARHQQLLERLTALDKRVEAVLAECLSARDADPLGVRAVACDRQA